MRRQPASANPHDSPPERHPALTGTRPPTRRWDPPGAPPPSPPSATVPSRPADRLYGLRSDGAPERGQRQFHRPGPVRLRRFHCYGQALGRRQAVRVGRRDRHGRDPDRSGGAPSAGCPTRPRPRLRPATTPPRRPARHRRRLGRSPTNRPPPKPRMLREPSAGCCRPPRALRLRRSRLRSTGTEADRPARVGGAGGELVTARPGLEVLARRPCTRPCRPGPPRTVAAPSPERLYASMSPSSGSDAETPPRVNGPGTFSARSKA